MQMLAVIEQAMKDALERLNTDATYAYHGYVRTIKSYGGEFDDAGFEQAIQSLPAIWVTFKSSSKPSRKGSRKRERQYEFTVLVGANSSRREETARQGAYTTTGELLNVGSYQLIELVEKALDGRLLTYQQANEEKILPLTRLEGGAIRTVFNTQTEKTVVSVLSYDFVTTHSYVVADDEDDDEPWLESIDMHYQDYVTDPDTGKMVALPLAGELIRLG